MKGAVIIIAFFILLLYGFPSQPLKADDVKLTDPDFMLAVGIGVSGKTVR